MVIETMMTLLTLNLVQEGEHQLVSTEAGFRPIEHLQLNFYGVKSEAQEQRIQVRNRLKVLTLENIAFEGDENRLRTF